MIRPVLTEEDYKMVPRLNFETVIDVIEGLKKTLSSDYVHLVNENRMKYPLQIELNIQPTSFAFLLEVPLWRQQSDQMILVPDYSRWRNEWNLNSFPLKSKTSIFNQKKSPQPLNFIRKIS